MKINDIMISTLIVLILFILFSLVSPMKYMLIVLFILLSVLVYIKIDRKAKSAQDEMLSLSHMIEDLLDNKNRNIPVLQDGLLSKIQHQLYKFSNIILNFQEKEKDERIRLESLISDISHQLKTPLANLKMYQSLLEETNEVHFFQKIMKQTEKLEWLIDSLMKLSRIESNSIEINMKDVNLNLTILEAINLVYLKASNKGINIKYEPSDIMLTHDTKWSTEAISNVLDNAIKYSSDESEIIIELEKNEMFYSILIKDFGIGVAVDEMNNIFKRFHRGSHVHELEGVGIGLYLAQEIMNKQGGYIYCKEAQVGSEFYINIRV